MALSPYKLYESSPHTKCMVDGEGQNVTDIGYVWYHTLWNLGPNPSGSSGARGGSWDDDTGFVTDPVVLHFRRHATIHFTCSSRLAA